MHICIYRAGRRVFAFKPSGSDTGAICNAVFYTIFSDATFYVMFGAVLGSHTRRILRRILGRRILRRVRGSILAPYSTSYSWTPYSKPFSGQYLGTIFTLHHILGCRILRRVRGRRRIQRRILGRHILCRIRGSIWTPYLTLFSTPYSRSPYSRTFGAVFGRHIQCRILRRIRGLRIRGSIRTPYNYNAVFYAVFSNAAFYAIFGQYLDAIFNALFYAVFPDAVFYALFGAVCKRHILRRLPRRILGRHILRRIPEAIIEPYSMPYSWTPYSTPFSGQYLDAIFKIAFYAVFLGRVLRHIRGF